MHGNVRWDCSASSQPSLSCLCPRRPRHPHCRPPGTERCPTKRHPRKESLRPFPTTARRLNGSPATLAALSLPPLPPPLHLCLRPSLRRLDATIRVAALSTAASSSSRESQECHLRRPSAARAGQGPEPGPGPEPEPKRGGSPNRPWGRTPAPPPRPKGRPARRPGVVDGGGTAAAAAAVVAVVSTNSASNFAATY